MASSKQRKDETMKNQTMGTTIAALRKEQGLTQLDLAEKMGVTDKAVSKWERDLACPDVNSLPKLAQILNVTVEELMLAKPKEGTTPAEDHSALLLLICKAIALAMGVAVAVLSMLNQLDMNSGFGMLGVGLVSLSILAFQKKD